MRRARSRGPGHRHLHRRHGRNRAGSYRKVVRGREGSIPQDYFRHAESAAFRRGFGNGALRHSVSRPEDYRGRRSGGSILSARHHVLRHETAADRARLYTAWRGECAHRGDDLRLGEYAPFEERVTLVGLFPRPAQYRTGPRRRSRPDCSAPAVGQDQRDMTAPREDPAPGGLDSGRTDWAESVRARDRPCERKGAEEAERIAQAALAATPDAPTALPCGPRPPLAVRPRRGGGERGTALLFRSLPRRRALHPRTICHAARARRAARLPEVRRSVCGPSRENGSAGGRRESVATSTRGFRPAGAAGGGRWRIAGAKCGGGGPGSWRGSTRAGARGRGHRRWASCSPAGASGM